MTPLEEKLTMFNRQLAAIMETARQVRELIRAEVPTTLNARIAAIQAVVCEHYGIPAHAMASRIRKRSWAYPRQLALYLARELTNHSLTDIAKSFREDMDHGTVMHACNAVADRIKLEPDFAATAATLRARATDRIESITMPLFANTQP